MVTLPCLALHGVVQQMRKIITAKDQHHRHVARRRDVHAVHLPGLLPRRPQTRAQEATIAHPEAIMSDEVVRRQINSLQFYQRGQSVT
jgi:hypothetical protein